MNFHAISAPMGQGDSDASNLNPEERIFSTTVEALKALKTNKQSRLKSFENYENALNFAKQPFNMSNDRTNNDKTGQVNKSAATPSEGCPYKSLSPQELKELRLAIANEDDIAFEKLVSENPRYLTTPCDTPSILHSGTRANALHVAATEGGSLWGNSSPKMTEKVLDAILNPHLMERMYPGESAEAKTRRQEFLFDMYLNTPLKGSNDTPLHIASKFGALDVVALLVQFSSCDTKRLNKENQTPADVVGSRMSNTDTEVVKKILQLLSENHYIPIYRVSDHSQPAFIGELWSPRRPKSMLSAKSYQDDIIRSNSGDGGIVYNDNAVNNNDQSHLTSPSIDLDSLSPIMIRQQLQGVKSTLTGTHSNSPHSDNDIDNLQTSFSSPLPSANNNSTTSTKKRDKSPLLIVDNRYPVSPLVTPKTLMGPPTKQSPIIQNISQSSYPFDSSGYNTSTSSCRSMSSPLSVQAILGPFSNIEEAKKIQKEWRKPRSRSNLIRLKDPEKGLEKEGRSLANKYNSSIIEYWDFLGTYCDLTSDNGLTQLDDYLHEKMECRVCMTPKSNSAMEESSFMENYSKEEKLICKQQKIEQDKVTQLQNLLADVHITPKVQISYGTSDEYSSVGSTYNDGLSKKHSESYSFEEARDKCSKKDLTKLTLDISSQQEEMVEHENVNMINTQAGNKLDPLSPSSIWSRTRESKHNLSTASSNESASSPFKFNTELENTASPFLPESFMDRRNDGYESDSESSSFHSVASSLQSSVLTAEEGTNWVYLLGNLPTDTDRQVYEAIKDMNVSQYPSINNWKILVETFTVQQRQQWGSHEHQIKNLGSDLLINNSNLVNDVKSELLFEDD